MIDEAKKQKSSNGNKLMEELASPDIYESSMVE